MLLYVCDECRERVTVGIREARSLPKDWIGVSINDLMRCVCSWKCAEQLSCRMAANKEHPGNDSSSDRPARVAPPIMVPLATDPKPEKAGIVAARQGAG